MKKSQIDEFLTYLEVERRYSKQTIKAYASDLDQFQGFLDSTDPTDLADLTYTDIRLFIAYLHEQGIQRTSVARKLSSLRTFFKYSLRKGWIEHNPMELVHYSSKRDRLPDFFYEAEIDQILQLARQSKLANPKRNLAIIELLYATGMRVAELVGLEDYQVDFQNQIIRVRGKGDKERIVPVGDAAIEALTNYCQEERPKLLALGADPDLSHHLFLSDKGQALSEDQVRRILNLLSQEGGNKLKIHPHKFRHTFASHLMNHGADMRSVQELLGHEDLSSTQIYTHITKDNLKKAYMQAFPRARRLSEED
ncbi:tyrosine recombinase XerC [Hutsoniella sourekii]